MWEAAGGICGKRLELCIPELVAKLQEWEEIRITTHLGKQLCAMSAWTIARVLRTVQGPRVEAVSEHHKAGSLLKAALGS